MWEALRDDTSEEVAGYPAKFDRHQQAALPRLGWLWLQKLFPLEELVPIKFLRLFGGAIGVRIFLLIGFLDMNLEPHAEYDFIFYLLVMKSYTGKVRNGIKHSK